MRRLARRRPLFGRIPAVLLTVIIIGFPVIPDSEAKGAGPEMGRASPPPFSNWSNDSLIVPWHDPTIQPSIAACPDGSLFVVWVDGRTGTPRIFFKKLDPTGATIVPETQVSGDGIDIDNSTPVALAGQDGSLHVLWPGHFYAGRCFSICHRSFNATGAPTSDTVENWLNTTLAAEGAWVYRNITASSLPDGNISAAFEVTWNYLINTPPPEKYPTIGWMRLAPNGTKLAEAGLNMITHDNATPVKQRNPTVAVDAGGRTHAFWVDIAEPSTPMLRWSLLNGSGAGVQGFMTLSGEPGPSLCAVNGPADDMSVVFIDRESGPVKMASYPAAGTPVNASVRTIYYWDINASGEMTPRWSVRAVRYGAGNVIVVCEGDPVGDFGPNIIPYSIGLFAVASDGSVIMREPQFINENFDAMTPPSAPPPHLLPALAASPHNELFLCWQRRFGNASERPLGLHLVHTIFGDIGLKDLRFHHNGAVPLINGQINVTAELFNMASRAAENFTVSFSVDGVVLETRHVSLEAGGWNTLGFIWTAVWGNHSFAIQIDPGANQNDDTLNDLVEGQLRIFLPPDLFIAPEDILFSDKYPFAGQQICITASVGNAGEIPGEGELVISLDGVRLAAERSLIAPSDHYSIPVVWTAVAGNHTVNVEIINCSPPDGNLSNNTASKELSVHELTDIFPNISIDYPTTGVILSGIVEIRGTASISAYPDLLEVHVRIDGSPWRPAAGKTNWTFGWNTSTVPDGRHTIEARASFRQFQRNVSVVVETRNPLSPALWFETLSPADNFTMHEDQTLRFTAEARARPVPGGIGYQWYVDGVICASGEDMTHLEFSANFSSAGNHTVSVMALVNSTPEPLRAYHSWNITVINVDRPPIITSAIPLEFLVVYNNDNPPYIFVLAKDPDGDALTYSWELDGAPVPGADELFFEARSIKPGTHNLSVTVSAGGLNATGYWQLRVQAPPATVTLPQNTPCLTGLLVVAIGMAVAVLLARRLNGRRV
jgi:hypothetical protein